MAALNIKRLPGEDEADFQRRYCREKMRIYRARKPKSTRKRGKAKGPKADGLLTPEQWQALQRQPGESPEDHARRYRREVANLYRRRNGDEVLARARAAYALNREAGRERCQRYRAANGDKIKAAQRRYFEANREQRLAAIRGWRATNPERYKAAQKRWYDENRALRNSYSAKWRRACRQQTPPWADHDAIKAFYAEAIRLTAETGVEHHVDHIIPIRGRTVSGLHVQTNLRVIPAVENMRKHNRLIPELAAA